jgi:5-methylcytosine-specific restriction endonuclease McrA
MVSDARSNKLLLSKYIRNSEWPKLRRRFKKRYPECAVCGKVSSGCNVVHHIKPYQWYPELELDEDNLIVLCKSHHLTFGHLMQWASYNLDVRKDADEWNSRIKERPKWMIR